MNVTAVFAIDLLKCVSYQNQFNQQHKVTASAISALLFDFIVCILITHMLQIRSILKKNSSESDS